MCAGVRACVRACLLFHLSMSRELIGLHAVLCHSHTGSYDFWIVRFMIGCDWAKVRPVGNVCYDLQQRSHSDRSLRVLALSRTIGEYRYQERSYEIVRQLIEINDRCTINRDGRRPMVRSNDRYIMRPIVRAIVAPEYRRYDQSWGATTDRTIIHSMVRLIVRSIVATYDQSYDQSWHQRFGIAG